MRHALIVGASRGIGHALAHSLADAGWQVSTASRNPPDSQVGAWHRADVSDPTQAEALVRACEPIDALVICVGDFHRARVTEESPESWRQTFASNLDPVFALSRAALPGMIERRWGRILCFTMAGLGRGSPRLAAYHAAKAGVLALTRSLAAEGAPFGVTANCIAPGLIESSSPDELARMSPRVPAGRPGSLNEVVATARFLLSDEAGYLSGAEIPLSGGLGV